jgi:hypothetical protein
MTNMTRGEGGGKYSRRIGEVEIHWKSERDYIAGREKPQFC